MADDDRGMKCWICSTGIQAKQMQDRYTGLCGRCYAREYRRFWRMGKAIPRTVQEARDAGREDLADLLGAWLAQPQAVTGRLAPKRDDPPPVVKAPPDPLARFRDEVVAAACSWYRSPLLSASSKRLKSAVEALSRAQAAPVSREVPD